jgi:hypothetical protein
MRARYFDSAIGRFISEDPLGFTGGDANFYGYVANDPVFYYHSQKTATELLWRTISAPLPITVPPERVLATKSPWPNDTCRNMTWSSRSRSTNHLQTTTLGEFSWETTVGPQLEQKAPPEFELKVELTRGVCGVLGDKNST